jgi:NADH-quinone oxidoreductase subunit M
LPFLILTTFLTTLCIFLSFNLRGSKKIVRDYLICFFFLEAILIGVFSSLDILIFYIFFEAVLIPMFFIIGKFGSRSRKIRASYLLFLYTLLSSILMFLGIIFLYSLTGTTNLIVLTTIKLEPFFENIC